MPAGEIVAVHRDVTSQKKAEEELLASEQRSLTFESELGRGTKLVGLLPIDGVAPASAAADGGRESPAVA